MDTYTQPPQSAVSKNSAIEAGWICLILGCCTFWILGFGFVFFGVCKILAIVGMCTDHVKQGIILLISSFVAAAVCSLIFVIVMFGSLSMIADKASDGAIKKSLIQR